MGNHDDEGNAGVGCIILVFIFGLFAYLFINGIIDKIAAVMCK